MTPPGNAVANSVESPAEQQPPIVPSDLSGVSPSLAAACSAPPIAQQIADPNAQSDQQININTNAQTNTHLTTEQNEMPVCDRLRCKLLFRSLGGDRSLIEQHTINNKFSYNQTLSFARDHYSTSPNSQNALASGVNQGSYSNQNSYRVKETFLLDRMSSPCRRHYSTRARTRSPTNQEPSVELRRLAPPNMPLRSRPGLSFQSDSESEADFGSDSTETRCAFDSVTIPAPD